MPLQDMANTGGLNKDIVQYNVYATTRPDFLHCCIIYVDRRCLNMPEHTWIRWMPDEDTEDRIFSHPAVRRNFPHGHDLKK